MRNTIYAPIRTIRPPRMAAAFPPFHNSAAPARHRHSRISAMEKHKSRLCSRHPRRADTTMPTLPEHRNRAAGMKSKTSKEYNIDNSRDDKGRDGNNQDGTAHVAHPQRFFKEFSEKFVQHGFSPFYIALTSFFASVPEVARETTSRAAIPIPASSMVLMFPILNMVEDMTAEYR